MSDPSKVPRSEAFRKFTSHKFYYTVQNSSKIIVLNLIILFLNFLNTGGFKCLLELA